MTQETKNTEMENQLNETRKNYEKCIGPVPMNKKNDQKWMESKIVEFMELRKKDEKNKNEPLITRELPSLQEVKFNPGLKVYVLFYHDGYKWRCDDKFYGGENFYTHQDDVQRRIADHEAKGFKTKVLYGFL